MNKALNAENKAAWSPDEVDTLVYRWRQENRSFAIATVVDTGGSTPRLKGARLVSDGQTFGGTIGGGAVEKHVLDHIQAMIDGQEASALLQVHLVRDLAMCCGGKMSIFVNRIDAKPVLRIYGAGHIGTALARLAAQSIFNVELIDDREAWIDPEKHSALIKVFDEDPVRHAARAVQTERTFVCVVTHAHERDQSVIEKLLLSDVQTEYIGMIGSRAKWQRFKDRLTHKGIDDAALSAVTCPAGLDIGAETPEEIAVSVFAEMIQTYRKHFT